MNSQPEPLQSLDQVISTVLKTPFTPTSHLPGLMMWRESVPLLAKRVAKVRLKVWGLQGRLVSSLSDFSTSWIPLGFSPQIRSLALRLYSSIQVFQVFRQSKGV